ncbi:MAG: GNAT family N-acetyltransferase [bacterium]
MIKKINNLETIEKCSDLYVKVFRQEPWNEDWKIDTALNRLKDYYNTPGFMGLCSLEQDEITGCVIGNIEHFYNGNYFHLKEIFIDVECQRKGIGKKILNELKSLLLLEKVKSILLFTAERSEPQMFYKANGFSLDNKMCLMSADL